MTEQNEIFAESKFRVRDLSVTLSLLDGESEIQKLHYLSRLHFKTMADVSRLDVRFWPIIPIPFPIAEHPAWMRRNEEQDKLIRRKTAIKALYCCLRAWDQKFSRPKILPSSTLTSAPKKNLTPAFFQKQSFKKVGTHTHTHRDQKKSSTFFSPN